MPTTSKPIRVYADTSVYGGVFDEEFEAASKKFFDKVRKGKFRLVVSTVVRNELEDAPERVFSLFDEIQQYAEIVDVSNEAVFLQQAYLAAGIIGSQWKTDALHVALATDASCPIIVSWNFKHLANFKKIPQYNGVNLAHGYGSVAIYTPQEVIDDDED